MWRRCRYNNKNTPKFRQNYAQITLNQPKGFEDNVRIYKDNRKRTKHNDFWITQSCKANQKLWEQLLWSSIFQAQNVYSMQRLSMKSAPTTRGSSKSKFISLFWNSCFNEDNKLWLSKTLCFKARKCTSYSQNERKIGIPVYVRQSLNSNGSHKM